MGRINSKIVERAKDKEEEYKFVVFSLERSVFNSSCTNKIPEGVFDSEEQAVEFCEDWEGSTMFDIYVVKVNPEPFKSNK